MAYAKPDRQAPFKEKLKSSGAPGGAWLLCGQESYLSSYYLSLLRKKVIPDAELGYFDHIRLSGAEKTEFPLGARLASAIEGLPVMNESKLIEIAEPCFSDMKPTDLKEFCAVLETLEDYPYVTVVLCCAEEEFPTDYRAETGTLWKSLEKAGMHIVPFPLQTVPKLVTWCAKHLASEGIEAAPAVIEQMIASVGSAMTALAGEMEKLCCYLHANERTVVTREDVALICSVTETAEAFGIQSAVRARDIQTLFHSYLILKNEKNDAITIFFQISAAISELWKIKTGIADGYSKEELMHIHKMKEYPLRLAMQACGNYTLPTLSRLMTLCAETDVLLKSSVVDGYVLVERLICAISKSYENELQPKA